MGRIALVVAGIFAFSSIALAAEPVYPVAEWARAEPAKRGFDPVKFADLDRYAFDPEARFSTDGLLVIAGGALIYERYARDYTATMRHYGWSITKSVSMALFGIAEAEGKIRREDPIEKWVPEAKAKNWDGVRMEHLLSMSSGIEWREGYEASPFDSHVVTALYRTKASFDFGLYRAGVSKRISPPGIRFNYSSGDTNILMRALRKALGSEYEDFPWVKLFGPIGMTSAVMERDGAGNFIGSSYMAATPRDFARFGYLFLREGKWAGKQILPTEFAKLAAKPSPSMENLRLDHRPKDSPYGYSWWLNRPFPQAQIGKPYPGFPDDMFLASGHDGQEIIVVPSWDLVVVRLGNDRFGKRMDLSRVGAILKAARR